MYRERYGVTHTARIQEKRKREIERERRKKAEDREIKAEKKKEEREREKYGRRKLTETKIVLWQSSDLYAGKKSPDNYSHFGLS